jgi:hypothetical protein
MGKFRRLSGMAQVGAVVRLSEINRSKMLKFTKTMCVAVLLMTIAWASVANADGEGIGAPLGSYSGGGYRVILDGRTGEYVGFDRQGRKLVINQNPSYPADQTAQWKHKGFTYRIAGIGEPVNNAEDFRKVRLTIFNPQGRVILNQIMNRI